MDKNSKMILDYLIQNGGCDYLVDFDEELDEMADDLNINSEDLRANVRFLKENGYLEYQRYSSGHTHGFFLSHKGVHYKEFESQPQNSPTFHINNAYGSVIGTQQNVTLNYKSSLSQLKSDVNACNSEDKESLQKIVSLLEMILDNQVPPNKGIFSKFSAVMERNSWFTSAVSSTIMGWLMTQIS